MAPALLLEVAHSLSKRDGNQDLGGVPKWALVILIMLAAGFGVVLVYGIARFMFPEKQGMKPVSAEQADYMREVRARNLAGLMAESGGRGYRYRRSEQSYAGASTTA